MSADGAGSRPKPSLCFRLARRATGIVSSRCGVSYFEDDDGLVPGTPSLVSVHGGFGQPGGFRGTNDLALPDSWHTSVELADPEQEPHCGFLFVFGSYLMDWPYGNAFQRTFLGMANYGLGSLWFQAGNPQVLPSIQSLQFEKMALGETIASEYLRTMNEDPTLTTANLFISWQGDPTLRWQILAPPSNLSGTPDGTTVNLTWNASPEASQYWVYLSATGLHGTWERITQDPVSTTAFSHENAPPESKLYQVRALKLTTTASGSYTNLSMGIFTTVN